MRVYALWDRKLAEFAAPSLAKNDEAMMRAVRDGIRGSNSLAERHPEDFEVMYLGEFYPETGFLAGLSGPPISLGTVEAICNGQG